MFIKFIIKNLFVLNFLLLTGISAQDKSESQTSPPLPIIDKSDDGDVLMMLRTMNVAVWSEKKGFLKDLSAENFELYDEKESRKIQFFSKLNEPVSIGVLFDLSASMESNIRKKINKIPSGVAGLLSAVNNGNPKNEYFVVGFAKEPKVMLEATQNREQIARTFSTLLATEPEGNTSFYDALSLALEKIRNGKFNRKVLIVFSDGQENSSENSDFREIKKLIRKENVSLHMINFVINSIELNSNEAVTADRQLQQLTQNSGGRIYYAKNEEEVVGAFRHLAEEVNNQYVIGFEPILSKKQEWHDIRIKCNLPKEKKKEFGEIFVRSANGYYSQ